MSDAYLSYWRFGLWVNWSTDQPIKIIRVDYIINADITLP